MYFYICNLIIKITQYIGGKFKHVQYLSIARRLRTIRVIIICSKNYYETKNSTNAIIYLLLYMQFLISLDSTLKYELPTGNHLVLKSQSQTVKNASFKNIIF